MRDGVGSGGQLSDEAVTRRRLQGQTEEVVHRVAFKDHRTHGLVDAMIGDACIAALGPASSQILSATLSGT